MMIISYQIISYECQYETLRCCKNISQCTASSQYLELLTYLIRHVNVYHY